MQWTTERPTEPGYYWVRIALDRPTIEAVRRNSNGVLHIQGCPLDLFGTGDEQGLQHKYEWFGPLTPPP